MNDEKIIIFDTTLRDGEQCPGASLNINEKIEIARQLAILGVDVIEAGFPISSPGDFEAVKRVAKEVKGPVICGLARAISKDIDTAYNAVKNSNAPRIHVFLATSKIHMKYKLKKAEDEIYRLAIESVKYASKICDDGSNRSGMRMDLNIYLTEVCTGVRQVVDNGDNAKDSPMGFLAKGRTDRLWQASQYALGKDLKDDPKLDLKYNQMFAPFGSFGRMQDPIVKTISEYATSTVNASR